MTQRITRSQIEAARLLVKMLEEDGEPVPNDLRALAALDPDSVEDSA